MAHYLICYDLNEAQSYPRLADLLEDWGAARLLESVWVVSADVPTLDLRNMLKSVLSRDDSLAVIELREGSLWACENAEQEGLAWLRQRILA